MTEKALQAIEPLPCMTELDEAQTLEEVEKVIDKLASGQAPGKEGIPAEVIKCAKKILKDGLHELLVSDGKKAGFLKTSETQRL